MELKERDAGELLYRVQLNEFETSLRKYGSKDDSPIKDWFDAFHRLEILLNLVTTFGLKMNMYSSRVQRVVTLDDLFSI